MTVPATTWRRHAAAALDPSATPDGLPFAARQERPAVAANGSNANDALLCSLVGTNLRRLRTRQRLSLEQLSALSGVSRAMLCQIEHGKSVPSIRTLWQVSQALGVSVSWFLEPTHEQEALLLQPPPESAWTLPQRTAEIRPLQRSRDGHQDAFLELRLAPGATCTLPAVPWVRRVNVAVSAGVLEVVLNDQRHLVRPREALQYETLEELSWHNSGHVQVQAFVLARAADARSTAQ